MLNQKLKKVPKKVPKTKILGSKNLKFSKEYGKYNKNSELNQVNLPIFFDNSKLEKEFELVNSKLKGIVWYAAFLCIENFQSPLIITHILRTQEEQDEIYKNDKKYQKSPWKSVHQFNRGVDVRLHNIGIKNATMLAKKINSLFPYKKGTDKKTVLVHDIGHGNHIHFQVNY